MCSSDLEIQTVDWPSALQAGAVGIPLGIPASFLCRHQIPVARSPRGRKPGCGPQIELCSVCGQPGADGSVWGKIMVSRLVVGAHYGLRDWIAQRATAVVMAGYSLWFGVWVLVDPPQNYGAWKTMIGTGWMRIATLL